jgi:tetratricopeptide (TPR) repeat protein
VKNQTDFQTGIELKRQGQFEEAIAAYRRSIETNPGFSWTYYELGEALAELGRLEEAVSSYKQAIALNSVPDCFHSKLEQVLNQLGCQDVKGLVDSKEKSSNKDLQTHFEELNQLDVESAIDNYKKYHPVSQDWLSLYYKNVYRLLYRITPGDIYVKYLELLKPLFEHVKYQSSCQNIYQCCTPKTGSQWFRQILADVRVFEYSGLTPFPIELFYQTQGAFLPSNTIVNGTFCLKFDSYMSLRKPQSYKTFFIRRDPRDYIVSNYFSTKFSHKPIGDIPKLRERLQNMSIEDGLIEIIHDNQKKNIFEVMRSWIDANQKDPNVMIIRFEDLVGINQFAVMKEMFSHCDVQIPDSILQELIDDYSFEKLSSGRKKGQEDQMSNYRKGVPGDWTNYFSEKIEDKFYEVTGNLVTDLGY